VNHSPARRLTVILQLDQPSVKTGAFWFHVQGEGKPKAHFQTGIGNWFPRDRVTSHAALPIIAGGWRFSTGVQDGGITKSDLDRYGHHVFIADRPVFHQTDGKNKERVFHIALSTDVVQPGATIQVKWKEWDKGLAPLAAAKLTALYQHAPALATDDAAWKPLSPIERKAGEATIVLPASLKEGLAWLRVGLSARNFAEIPLVVTTKKDAPQEGKAELQTLQIGPPGKESRVPDPFQQGPFLHPQAVSALDINDDDGSIAVATMAFRHDRNLWLIGRDGKIQWGRFVEPWAPFQTAILPGGFIGVGLAYSRFTDPSPTLSLFEGEQGQETALVDSVWDMGWLRYGEGNWRRGWPVSMIGDLLVRSRSSLVTVASHDGAWQVTKGSRQRYPLHYQRPFRMASSEDGHVLAFGYLTPDASKLNEITKRRLRLPPALLRVDNSSSAATLWTADGLTDTDPVPRPPEPALEFGAFTEDFNMKPQEVVPFRVPLGLAVNADGSKMALTEYGGWFRIKRQRGIGAWNPDHQIAFCPRQKGWLRVFGPLGKEEAKIALPREGLFDVHWSPQGNTLWCVPMSWFARGMAGRPWLPADPGANQIFVFDVRRKSWSATWKLPDAVSDFAVHSAGALISCWNGKTYLVSQAGTVRTTWDVGQPARLRWARDGRFAVLGSQNGEVWGLDERGKVLWKTPLPVAEVPRQKQPLMPIFEGVPIYSVGRVGKEHAYVGDIWLIKTKEGGILVDSAGTSGIPLTLERIRAAGIDPKDIRYVLLSHSHGDHVGAAHLWRARGAKIVAPATAEFTVTWCMPTWSDYSIWPPCPVDMPLPLKKAGDETTIKLCGLPIKAIFIPGHSFDSVIYVIDFPGKRVAFTGDMGFEGVSDILHRCWGDRDKALPVMRVVRDQVIPLRPDHVFTGHGPRPNGTAFLRDLLQRSEKSVQEKKAK
jgi:metallo-beta-lactamase class B